MHFFVRIDCAVGRYNLFLSQSVSLLANIWQKIDIQNKRAFKQLGLPTFLCLPNARIMVAELYRYFLLSNILMFNLSQLG